jgi:predicted metal-dependent peptidase
MNIVEEYRNALSVLLVTMPFAGSLLGRVKVIATDSVDTAAVTGSNILLINPGFWENLSSSGRVFVLAHEVLHLAFMDHLRMGSRDPLAWNLVCDGVNNSIIMEFIEVPDDLKHFSVTLNTISLIVSEYFSVIRDMSKEELYNRLPKTNVIVCPVCGSRKIDVVVGNGYMGVRCRECGFSTGGNVPDYTYSLPADPDLGFPETNGTVVSEGDREFDGLSGEELERKWKEAVSKAYSFHKSVRAVPAGLKRAVDSFLKSKVAWTVLLRQAFRTGFGRIVVESWSRVSRKCSLMPGTRKLANPKVHVLIDTSGSITELELEQFVGEVVSIVGLSSAKVVCWDSRAYEVIDARTKYDVIRKVAPKIKGGGSTFVAPALRRTLENLRFGDAVIILTDGEIFDLEDAGTVSLFSAVASKASASIFVTTKKVPAIKSWRVVKLDL